MFFHVGQIKQRKLRSIIVISQPSLINSREIQKYNQLQMMLQSQYRNKNDELTVSAVRKKHRIVIRNTQLQQIFKAIRANISRVQYYYQPPIQINTPFYQPITPLFTPENIICIQQYLSQFQLFPQSAIPSDISRAINSSNIESKSIVSRPLNQQNIYFQRRNIRVYNKLIGEGSYSKVWQGMDLRTRKKVAVKQIYELDEDEIKCLKKFTSPYIIKIQEIIRHKEYTYLVLQYCQHNLKEQLVRCNYQLTLVLKYFDQIVEGMDVLQKANVIHRDLKFQNILLCDGVIKIADFGLARFLGDDLQIESKRCGSPYTMSPEIFFSYKKKTPYTSKCDIWSLGILLHMMLYKNHPFNMKKQQFWEGNRIKIKKKYGVLDKLIDRCLMKEPEQRINWSQFKELYQQYKLNQSRYQIINEFPIQVESVIIESKVPIQKNIKKQSKRDKYYEHFPNTRLLYPNLRQQQNERKRIADYNACQEILRKQISKQLPKLDKMQKIKYIQKDDNRKSEQLIKEKKLKMIFLNKSKDQLSQSLSRNREERVSKQNKTGQGQVKEKYQQTQVNRHTESIYYNSYSNTRTHHIKDKYADKTTLKQLCFIGLVCIFFVIGFKIF